MDEIIEVGIQLNENGQIDRDDSYLEMDIKDLSHENAARTTTNKLDCYFFN